MEVLIHRSMMEVGNGPLALEVFTVVVPRVKIAKIVNGPLVFVETDEEIPPLVLPYVIWHPEEPRVRFRWAWRPASTAEQRLGGIASHGVAKDLSHAAVVCLVNHLERARVREDQP